MDLKSVSRNEGYFSQNELFESIEVDENGVINCVGCGGADCEVKEEILAYIKEE